MNGFVTFRFAIADLAALRHGRGSRGQDLVEYAMLAGFMAVAVGALIPYGVVEPMNKIFTSLLDLLRSIGGAG